MDISTVIENIGAYTNEAIMIAAADPSDGAVMHIRWINPAFSDTLGYTLDDLVGKTARVLVGRDTSPASHAEAIARLQAWDTFAIDVFIARRDGSQFWAQMSFRPIHNAEGVVAYWICLIIDISSRKGAEAQLTDLSLIAQHTRDMVLVLDQKRHITWANASFTQFTGFTLEQAFGKRISDLLRSPLTDHTAAQQLIGALDNNQDALAELVLQRKDGSLFIAELEFQPIFDPDRVLIKYVSLIRDITERRVLELRYKAIFDETNAAISIKYDGRFLMVNRRFAQDHGTSVAALEGQIATQALPDVDMTDLERVEAQVAKSGQAVEWERDVRTPRGRMRHQLTKTFAVFDPLLRTNLICSVATDVTDIRRAERAVRQSQGKAKAAERRLWGALDAMSDGFVLYDAKDRLVMFNEAFRALHWRIGDKLRPGMTYSELVRAGLDVGQWDIGDADPDAWYQQHLSARETAMKDGMFVPLAEARWVLCKEVQLENGERAGVRVDVSDVKRNEADLEQARAKAERAERRMLAAVHSIGDGFSIYDAEDRLVLTNFLNAHLIESDEVNITPGMTFEEVLRVCLAEGVFPDAVGCEEQWLAQRMAHHNNPHGVLDQTYCDGRIFRLFERRTEDGDTVTFRLDVTREREQEARLADYARDLEASKAMVEQRNSALEVAKSDLEHASRHDALTGLANRRFLDQELQRRNAEGGQGNPRRGEVPGQMSVLHIDLDRFKQINDAFGHAAGDFVLRHVASVLRTETRAGDFAARVGGDEFVILCHGGRDKAQLGEFASRIIAELSKPLQYQGHECRFGASIGIAVGLPCGVAGASERMSEDISAVDQLLIDADIALYQAKAAGRNRWAFFTDALQAEVLASKVLSDQILRAIDNAEFEVLYQPQICAHTETVTGVEALLRWRHPIRGVLLPTEFMQVAEDLNVMPQIDAMVLRQVMRDDAIWQRAGLLIPRVAINVSGRRLRDPDLIKDIKEGGMDPARLSIEILESVFVDDDDEVLAWNIDQLREMGVNIELDDFGTGHSSIVGLINLKPHRLKIDRAFVEQTLAADADAAVIRALVQIGRSLDVEIVAEGIETVEQGKRLTALGCDVLQGFAYAVPMGVSALITYMRNKAADAAEPVTQGV